MLWNAWKSSYGVCKISKEEQVAIFFVFFFKI